MYRNKWPKTYWNFLQVYQGVDMANEQMSVPLLPPTDFSGHLLSFLF